MERRTRAQTLGREAEEAACRFLESQGLKLLERNYRCTHGEIDLVMQHGDSTVFVEVRYRRSTRFGTGAETVDARKQAKLSATAQHYLLTHRAAARRPSRFDVVSVVENAGNGAIDWIRNAFDT